MNTLRENKMGTMPVGKVLFQMALPVALSMLVQAVYNVVDSVPSLPLGGKMTLLKSNKSPMNSKIFLKFQEKNQIFS